MTRAQLLAQQSKYLTFLPHVRAQFGQLPGVLTIGLGAKEKGGKLLDQWAFRFYVSRKRTHSDLPEAERIPNHLFGLPTDVISHFEHEALTCPVDQLDIQDGEFRDLGIRGGISIRNEYFDNDHPAGYGTLGILARRKSDNALVGLTCAHVVNAAATSLTAVDTKIGQPRYWISCCCCPRGYIGDVKKATATDELDCALIEIHEDIRNKVAEHSTENKIESIAEAISGAAPVICFDEVRKYGRATGLTTGRVADVAYGDNQMLIERTGPDANAPFACHGDSGAVILNSANQVIGLLVAGAQITDVSGNKQPLTKAIATYIKPVMEDLGITIAGTDAVDIGPPVGGGGAGCELHAWPGGHADTALNPVEVFDSTDFGLSGNVDWDISEGAAGATIIETNGQTASNRSSISVRYDTTSASRNATDAVWVKATNGTDEVTKFRTVFTITPRAVNTSGALDSDNALRFAATGGSTDQAGVAVPGTDGATWFLAKAEIAFEVLPEGINWAGSGAITFMPGAPGGVEGNMAARRQTQFTKGEQASGAANRTHTSEADWVSAGDSTADDYQGATPAVPNEIFRLANEGFDPANLLQAYWRADFRDYLEFHNGTAWVRITPYAEWHANLTATLSGSGNPPPSVGTPNTSGTGATTEDIPNQTPTVTLTNSFIEVKPGEQVTLAATSADPDNDAVTIHWAQTDGPNVALSSPTGDSVTFNAPNDDFQFKFTATADDGTGGLPRTAGNHQSAAEEVVVNVIEWDNIGGGDPVPERNMTEDFNAADFGIGAGALNWDVTTGNVNAVIIEADGAPVAPTGTHNGASTIKVRYDNQSGNLTRAQTVRIQATHPGTGRSWFKRRTVFRVLVAVHATDTKSHWIASNQGATGMDHFCTAKQAGNLILDATLIPNPPHADVGWTATGRAITVPSVGADRTTAHINRNPGAGMRIPVKVQVDGDDVYECLVWIIWSTSAAVAIPIPTPVVPGATSTAVSGGYDFTFTIQPASIIPAGGADVPDLTGANTNDPPDVPAADATTPNHGDSLAGGATLMWDVTRRVRRKIINPSSIPFDTNGNHSNPEFYQTFPDFPSVEVVGNDDKHTGDENNDPYANGGVITSTDSPTRTPFHNEGSIGDTFEIRLQFGEFARVELDGNWYKISDFHNWKIHFLFRKDFTLGGGEWNDNGSFIAENNTGF